jgi:quercetin dioxygenase-like cupin family protein
MDRREFGTLLPALLAFGALSTEEASAQAKTSELPVIESGVYKPSAPHGSVPERMSRSYLTGLLKAGNVRLEMHETTQEVGAPHEPVGTVELTTNGVARRMVAGDVGICVAGDKHFIANVGDTKATYFVVTVGPIE